jgi:CDP-diglyceride synthetase
MEFLVAWIAGSLIGRSDDLVPRTRLGWTRVGLLAGLIGQIVYLIYTCMSLSVPTILWFCILANVVALIVVRRALRWRYPI